MSWTLPASALAVVISLTALTWSMSRVEREMAALRASLRRSRAAAVAIDELRRDSRTVLDDTARIDRRMQERSRARRDRRRRPRR